MKTWKLPPNSIVDMEFDKSEIIFKHRKHYSTGGWNVFSKNVASRGPKFVNNRMVPVPVFQAGSMQRASWIKFSFFLLFKKCLIMHSTSNLKTVGCWFSSIWCIHVPPDCESEYRKQSRSQFATEACDLIRVSPQPQTTSSSWTSSRENTWLFRYV